MIEKTGFFSQAKCLKKNDIQYVYLYTHYIIIEKGFQRKCSVMTGDDPIFL